MWLLELDLRWLWEPCRFLLDLLDDTLSCLILLLFCLFAGWKVRLAWLLP